MKNKMNDLANKRVAFIGSIISILLVAAVGFAYFSATVVNTNNEKLSTETATLSLKFDDGDSGISGTLNLGESITKKFTIQNTGTLDAYAKINWYNLVNTYMNGSLTYNLEQSTSENGTYTSIESSNVPVSSTETTETLKNGILVPVNTTYYYKLTITFNNLENVNQNSDINAKFYSYFSLEEGSLSGADKIKNLVAGANTFSLDVITKETPSGATCTNTLAYDGTVDNNLRYVGANPCNYVTFNGETAGWRIVGVMMGIDDGTGKKETRIKLVRNESLGNYSWDSSESSINSGWGVNDWTQADLMQELNGDYLNTSLTANTNWYNGINNAQTGVFDYTKRLSVSAQDLIDNAKWYLGGFATQEDRITTTMYTKERGTTTWSTTHTCSDGACPRATSWTGKVALIYPSDYGYATAGGNTTNRTSCIGTVTTNDWDNSSYSDCKNNDWLKPSSGYNWLLAPHSNSVGNAFNVYFVGFVGTDFTYYDGAVLPAVYLKSGVTISGGNGTEYEPYVLE